MRSRLAILQATLDLIGQRGFAAVNMTSVANAAHVSRQTVYSNFGSREQLVSQAVAMVALEAWGSVKDRLDETRTALEYVVEMLVAGRELARREPVLRALLRAEGGNPIFDENMMSRARPVVADMLSPMRARAPRLADSASFAGLVEMVARLGLSIVLFDSDMVQADDDLRRFLRHCLTPFL